MNQSSPVLFAPNALQLDKPLIVLLPGLDGTGKLFASQVPSLAKHFDIRCLSIPESNRQNWDDLAKSVIELIEDAQRSRLTYVCGESYGGCLALKLAMTAPEVINRLIVINPASALRHQTWLRWTTKAAPYVPEWVFNASGTLALPLLANFDRIDDFQRRLFINTVRPVSQACVLWRLAMLYDFEASPDRLQKLSIPTALLASGRDRLFPSWREVELLQKLLPSSKTYFLPESGHVCLLEEGVDLVSCLQALNFLPMPSSVGRS